MRRTGTALILSLLVALLAGCAQTMDTATAAAPVTAQAKPGAVIHRIQQRGELLVGTAGDMPPLNMTTRDGKVIGYDADLGRYISKAMGVQLKLKTMPFSELLSALESGKVDMVISGMTITPKRNLKAAFVGPYLSSGKCFLTKLDSLASAEDTDEIDVSNMTLTALKGSTSENFVKALLAKAKYLPADNYDEGVKMVLDGKVDAMVADYPICATSIIRYPEADLASLFTLLTYEPLGIALPPNDPLLVNWMQNLLNGLDGSGILKELKAKWFEDASWVKELP